MNFPWQLAVILSHNMYTLSSSAHAGSWTDILPSVGADSVALVHVRSSQHSG